MSLDANDILLARGSDGLRDVFDAAPRRNGSSLIKPSGPSVSLLPGSAFTPEAIRWLWRDWLARGKFHILAGAPGTGKTTIGLSLAAAISSGGHWPDGSDVGDAGDVLIWSGEDGVSDTLLPRLLASGADQKRVHFVGSVGDGEKRRPFDPASDMPHLRKAAADLTNIRLLILDPVVAAVTGDSHKNTETRRGLQPVVDLGAELDCAVLGITHLSKNTSGREPLVRVAGSLAFGAVARVVLLTIKDADREKPRRLVRAKSNLGPDDGGVAYVLFGAPVPGCNFSAQRVDWGEILEGTARELMACEQPDDSGDALEDAEEFLLDILRDGPVATKEIRAAASAHGHKPRTVDRAKQNLTITATKAGFDGGWAWKLPEAAKYANTDEERQHD
jgi:putative DNA primase/helicase